MKQVLIFGFYHKHNLGDDLFEFILNKWFTSQPSKNSNSQEYKLIFTDPYDIKELPNDLHCILVGGGDLVNDYFLERIRFLVSNSKFNYPIYGISLGAPYPKLITKEYLNIFDFIHTRTESAFPALQKVMPGRCAVGPDIVRSLVAAETEKKQIIDSSNVSTNDCFFQELFKEAEVFSGSSSNSLQTKKGLFGTKKIGVFLAQPMISKSENQELMLNKLVLALEKIANIGGPSWLKLKTYELYLYSMNTSGTQEDDSRLTRLIYARLKHYSNVHCITDRIKCEDVLNLFKGFYATVCTRFHAHILSINAGVPFVSLFSCEKVRDLLVSEDMLEYAELMKVNKNTLAPYDFDVESFFNKFQHMIMNHDEISTKLDIKCDLLSTKNCISNLLYYLPRFRSSAQDLDSVLSLLKFYFKKSHASDLNNVVVNEKNSSEITKMITFAISRKENDAYSWGLEKNLLKGANIIESVKWIVENKENTESKIYPYLLTTVPIEQRKYNFDYFGYEQPIGIHRFGWSGVVNELKKYHNPNGIIFDEYMDRTFGWNRESLTKLGLLPFKQPWTGVFHHTGDVEYDSNNLTACIKTKEFIDSLEYCESIIVLSTYLKDWLKKNLKYRVKIRVLYHPMEDFPKKWKYENWTANKDKKVIQIGAFLRNTFAIYALPKPKRMRKCAIRGKNMENYFPKDSFIDDFCKNFSSPVDGQSNNASCSSGSMCRHKANKFLTGLCDDVQRQLDSVEIIREVSNDEYDNLITSNVVFIQLINASACNTILECIRCNTPIVVNRLPAVIEYLGPGYPLYYNTLDEAVELLNNEHKLLQAHRYLKRKNKDFIDMSTFIDGVMNPSLKRKLTLENLNEPNDELDVDHADRIEEDKVNAEEQNDLVLEKEVELKANVKRAKIE